MSQDTGANRPLAVIPAYVRETQDVAMLRETLSSLRATAGVACDVIVIDDGSPARDLVKVVGEFCEEFDAEFVDKQRNEGFAKTVNVGLRRALNEGRDAVLVNADIEFGMAQDWLGVMQRQKNSDGDGLAAVVGALLVYPNGLIQHAGIFFSMLTRDFGHRFHYGPANLPEAHVATVCPVTGALQFIRHSCLETVGVYDETFKLGWEDVDYCVRVWLHGLECVYQPGCRAVHHESAIRGRRTPKIERWTQESWMRFCGKYATVSFAEFVPNLLAEAVDAG